MSFASTTLTWRFHAWPQSNSYITDRYWLIHEAAGIQRDIILVHSMSGSGPKQRQQLVQSRPRNFLELSGAILLGPGVFLDADYAPVADIG